MNSRLNWRHLAALFAAIAALLVCHDLVEAQSLVDPTRAPNATAAESNDSAAPAQPVLQSIVIGPGKKRTAVIGGKVVAAGDEFGDGVVERITANEVVLRTGKDREVLKLYPELKKGSAQKNSSPEKTKVSMQERH